MHAPGERTRRRAIGPATKATNAIGPAAATPSAASATPTQHESELGAPDAHAERGGGVVAELEPVERALHHDGERAEHEQRRARPGARAPTTAPLSEPVSHTAARWTS